MNTNFNDIYFAAFNGDNIIQLFKRFENCNNFLFIYLFIYNYKVRN
jgi:hypothetical protein